MNNWFNIKRFWLVLRHEFANAWIELAIFTGIFSAITYIPAFVFRGEVGKMQVILGMVGYGVVCCGILLFYWTLASRVFANIQRPERRIGYLTLPASNAEKFYARLLLYWLLPTAIGFMPSPRGDTIDSAVGCIIVALLITESSLAVLFGTIFRKGGLLILLLIETVIVISVVIYTNAYPWVINNLDFSIVARVMEYVGVDRPDMGRALKVAAMVAVPPTVFNIALARIIFSRKRLSRPLVNIDEQ
ncbi:MAG: hypothetical protein IKW77_10810 [Salinivirgaceae bacterium]|nr:hypothetical protein [Salinivirgaceae bacterium]